MLLAVSWCSDDKVLLSLYQWFKHYTENVSVGMTMIELKYDGRDDAGRILVISCRWCFIILSLYQWSKHYIDHLMVRMMLAVSWWSVVGSRRLLDSNPTTIRRNKQTRHLHQNNHPLLQIQIRIFFGNDTFSILGGDILNNSNADADVCYGLLAGRQAAAKKGKGWKRGKSRNHTETNHARSDAR